MKKITELVKEETTQYILKATIAPMVIWIITLITGFATSLIQNTSIWLKSELSIDELETLLKICLLLLAVLLSSLSIFVFVNIKYRNQIKTKLFPYFNVLWDKLKNPYCPNCQILLTNYNYSPKTATKPHFKCAKCKSVVTMHKNGKKLTIEEAKGLLPNIVGEYP